MSKWMTEPKPGGITHLFNDDEDVAVCGQQNPCALQIMTTDDGRPKWVSGYMLECTDLTAAKLCRECVYPEALDDRQAEYERRCEAIRSGKRIITKIKGSDFAK